jgi:hypothetical protein
VIPGADAINAIALSAKRRIRTEARVISHGVNFAQTLSNVPPINQTLTLASSFSIAGVSGILSQGVLFKSGFRSNSGDLANGRYRR